MGISPNGVCGMSPKGCSMLPVMAGDSTEGCLKREGRGEKF
jgi:hypothetical protein